MVKETMSPLQMLDRELKKLEPKARVENPFFLKLMRWLPPHFIESAKEYELFLEILKKISLVLNEAELRPMVRRHAHAKVQLEGYAQYARVIEEFIVHYERDRFPSPKSTPQDVLAFLMEQQGLSQLDIAKDLGGQPNVSNVLSGKRQLNVRQIKRLASRFHVNPGVFLSE
jgi:antitoxin component HigA of HigAB toxin-antitoxin module